MKDKNAKILTLCYIVFFVFMTLASYDFEGVLSDILYCSAFILPVVIGECYIAREGGERSFAILLPNARVPYVTLLFLAPSVAAVSLISFLTTLAINATTGASDSVELVGSRFSRIATHALAPAILEEMLFRYLPYRLLRDYPTKTAVAVSAIAFSCAHFNLFRIPYALFAGVTFSLMLYLSGSIIPSVLIHFINNLTSVVVLTYSDSSAVKIGVFVIYSLLLCLSLVIFALKRNEIKSLFRSEFTENKKIGFPCEILLFAIPAIILAIISLGG